MESLKLLAPSGTDIHISGFRKKIVWGHMEKLRTTESSKWPSQLTEKEQILDEAAECGTVSPLQTSGK